MNLCLFVYFNFFLILSMGNGLNAQMHSIATIYNKKNIIAIEMWYALDAITTLMS